MPAWPVALVGVGTGRLALAVPISAIPKAPLLWMLWPSLWWWRSSGARRSSAPRGLHLGLKPPVQAVRMNRSAHAHPNSASGPALAPVAAASAAAAVPSAARWAMPYRMAAMRNRLKAR